MKVKIYLTILLLVLFSGCSKNEIISPSGVTYQQSLINWNAFRQSVHNNYTYTATSGSVFGFRSETKITVKNGVVTGRDYTFYTQTPGTGALTITKTWSETSANLNTHGQYEGAETLTLDEVYTKAKSVWLSADKNNNTIYFETDSKGLILVCGFVPKGCQDDCFNGIRIKEIAG